METMTLVEKCRTMSYVVNNVAIQHGVSILLRSTDIVLPHAWSSCYRRGSKPRPFLIFVECYIISLNCREVWCDASRRSQGIAACFYRPGSMAQMPWRHSIGAPGPHLSRNEATLAEISFANIAPQSAGALSNQCVPEDEKGSGGKGRGGEERFLIRGNSAVNEREGISGRFIPWEQCYTPPAELAIHQGAAAQVGRGNVLTDRCISTPMRSSSNRLKEVGHSERSRGFPSPTLRTRDVTGRTSSPSLRPTIVYYSWTMSISNNNCVVAGCSNYGRKTSYIIYHRFPTNFELQKAWVSRCKRADSNVNSAVYFVPEDCERDLRNELLGSPIRKKLLTHAITSHQLPKWHAEQTVATGNALKMQLKVPFRRAANGNTARVLDTLSVETTMQMMSKENLVSELPHKQKMLQPGGTLTWEKKLGRDYNTHEPPSPVPDTLLSLKVDCDCEEGCQKRSIRKRALENLKTLSPKKRKIDIGTATEESFLADDNTTSASKDEEIKKLQKEIEI
ncbi:hypothetical protein PR048_028001 [Dryococelus australis]|uniref:THAP-type domain-containing protein n=1 Tax=Dryococelus australis TaxID=614101 RepID=A0ABQ9GI52_9NEOP|nr:hypothetical protein PR048_028001 [Dryococelus australis]